MSADSPRSPSPPSGSRPGPPTIHPPVGDPGQVQHRPITLSQHLFIWSMVVIVGVIFGIGSSFTMIFERTPQTVAGVADDEVRARMRTAAKLADLLGENPYRPRFTAPRMNEQGQPIDAFRWWADRIRRARIAADAGLMPTGTTLDRICERFLRTSVGGRLQGDILREYQGSPRGVTRAELERFLAEQEAVEALRLRHVIAPVVPALAAEDTAPLLGDRAQDRLLGQIEIDEAVLDAGVMLPTVSDDDPEIVATYDQLKARRFLTPERVHLIAAHVDLKALEVQIPADDAAIQKAYDAETARWLTPDGAGRRPLAEVAGEVAAFVRRQGAEERGRQLMEGMFRALEERGGSFDEPSFRELAKAQGLPVVEGIIATALPDGRVDLGRFGSIRDDLQILQQDPGWISMPLLAGDEKTGQHLLVLRMQRKDPPGHRPLADVRVEVKRAVAGRRAYRDFLAVAKRAAEAASALGPGGLRRYLASPEGAGWRTGVRVRTVAAFGGMVDPPAQPGGSPGERRDLAALALPERPVAVAMVEDDAIAAERKQPLPDVPRVRLVQVRGVAPVELAEADRRRNAEIWRNLLAGLRGTLFQQEIARGRE